MTLQIPGTLPILILEGAVVFPGAAARLEADEAGTKLARSILRSPEALVAIGLQRENEDGVHPIGVVARIVRTERSGGVVVEGLARVRILEVIEHDDKAPLAGRLLAAAERPTPWVPASRISVSTPVGSV